MLRVTDECRKHPQAGLLLQEDGRYARGYAFPFCHIAVLSNINCGQIEPKAPELTGSSRLPPPSPARNSRLGHAGAALLVRLKACFATGRHGRCGAMPGRDVTQKIPAGVNTGCAVSTPTLP